MKIDAFKAFIDGMDIADGEAPTSQQWARIVEKLESVQAEVRTEYVGTPSRFDTPPFVPPYTVT